MAMKQQPDPGDAESEGQAHMQTGRASAFRNPLPGHDRIWEDSNLGPSHQWPASLQSYVLTLALFPHPAAIFWGREYVLLHNKPWQDAGGLTSQGRRQRGSLTADAWEALQDAMRSGKPRQLAGHGLLKGKSNGVLSEEHIVLVSPLFDNGGDGDDKASGLLAQLLPKPNVSSGSVRDRESEEHDVSFGNRPVNKDQKPESANMGQLGTAVDNVPLDEHPFFHRFAEMLPSGLAILDHKAQAVFVNQNFYQLTTHQDDDQSFNSWPSSIHPDDFDRVMGAYQEAFKSQQQLRTEFRAQGGNHPWRLLLLTPLGDENLQHVSLRENGGFICSVVDISYEKSAELAERKAAKDAQERKEQQERFIDMISHEIRNPLSAVLHCSEDIEESVRDEENINIPAILEAVETINICIAHQKNIVDDVLSFSKLDASMLSLAPKSCQPSRQLSASLKMFGPEFRKQKMELSYRMDTSYVDTGIDWVMADLARIAQVLINLITNAIKFTARKDGEKKVVVSIAASHERPDSYPPNVVFFRPDELTYRMDATNTPDWGTGDVRYIMVAVKDTGIGISDEGQKRLFERFRQATPKTEEVYGGSGLGLNISRKLCHLHGGEIGVSSKEGDGSTFGFFFKVRLSEQPPDFPGRPEEDEIYLEQLRSQVTALGNSNPSDMDPTHLPESLESPPITNDDETRPHPTHRNDERFKKTQEIASHVSFSKQPTDDAHADSDDHESSEQHKTVEHLRSSNLTRLSHEDDKQHDRTGTPLTRSSTRIHVLLVEDNIINQRIVLRKLESRGFNVTTANNGRDAVNTVLESPKSGPGENGAFDVVLMDQEMPVMDGNAAAKELRELERKGKIEHIPILGVTANVRGAQQDEMMHSGMDGVITKPYKIEEMIAKINKIIAAQA